MDRPEKIGQTHRRFYERLGLPNWQLRKRLRTAEEIEREDRQRQTRWGHEAGFSLRAHEELTKIVAGLS